MSFHWRRAQQVSHFQLFADYLGPNDWGGPLDARAEAFEGAILPNVVGGRTLSSSDIRNLSRKQASDPPSSLK